MTLDSRLVSAMRDGFGSLPATVEFWALDPVWGFPWVRMWDSVGKLL